MPYKDAEKQREYQRKWRAKRAAEFFVDKLCVNCAADQELQLDHRDPEQKVDHRIWSWTATRREAELAKCVVRCRSCHLAKTLSGRELNSSAVLTVELVEVIRERYAHGDVTQRALATEYGIGQQAVSKLVRSLTWR